MKYEEYAHEDGEQWRGRVDESSTWGERQVDEDEVAPGVSIIRNSTPRPRSFGGKPPASRLFLPMRQEEGNMPSEFPSEAPSAPPLPEELSEGELDDAGISERHAQVNAEEKAQEFLWLFEYGLEMDSAIINSPERLNGLALFYGPAKLTGYRVVIGAQTIYSNTSSAIVAIIPSAEPDAEVWGVLYRIPRRVAERRGDEPSLLDTIHIAGAPQKIFQEVQMVVQEIYRNRAVTSVTYVPTESARQHLQFVSVEQWSGDPSFVQKLAAIARKHKLPESYVQSYTHDNQQVTPPLNATERTSPLMEDILDDSEAVSRMQVGGSRTEVDNSVGEIARMEVRKETEHEMMVRDREGELNTEPIPAFNEPFFTHESDLTPTPSAAAVSAPGKSRWLIAFSLYLVSLLLIALVFAVLQGLGFAQGSLTDQFMPLAVPWLVMMYGLLGGCISSIITLGRFRASCPPPYIIITWFTRPFIGAVLAVLSYLLLTSGLFSFGVPTNGRMALFLLAGALAGLGERWVFFKRRA
jgi:hypothetical protein